MQKFEGKREKPATTTKDVPYISTLDKPILSCFAEMKAEALDGNVDDVKLLAEKLRDETRAIEAAIKHYVAAAEQKASAKVLYNAVPVESFHGVRKVDNSVAA